MHQEPKTRRSCVADMPLRGEGDQLAADGYARALAAFIRTADTPLTIGIQGGWGSGKTSLFSLIRGRLEGRTKQDGPGMGEKTRPVVCVGVNAWEQSLFQGDASASHVAMNLLSDIIHALSALCDDPDSVLTEKEKTRLAEKVRNTRDALGSLKRSLLRGAEIGLSILAKKDMRGVLRKEGPDEESALPESPAAPLRKLRKTLDELVGCLPAAAHSPRLVIFIDDLDRVSPAAAVEILDVIKNIFDVPGCVFVLAIDYDVVVKGLEGKLGPRTGKNTHEFRQYLDKIIQVPFTMPVGAFSKNNERFIRHLFEILHSHTNEGELNENTRKSLEEIIRLATGSIPRSMKRIINTFSLLEYMETEKNPVSGEGGQRLPIEVRVLVVALHLNFPEICAFLVENPDFPQWSQNLDETWNLGFKNEEKRLHELGKNPELSIYFDAEWKKVVYCLCAKADWLKRNVVNIVTLLMRLKKYLDEFDDTGVDHRQNLSQTSITSLISFIEHIRPLSVSYTMPVMDSEAARDHVTEFMRGVHAGLIARFPELQFCALPKRCVAEEREVKKYYDGIGDIPFIERKYTANMRGDFENFSLYCGEESGPSFLDYTFKFFCPEILSEKIQELMGPLVSQATKELQETSASLPIQYERDSFQCNILNRNEVSLTLRTWIEGESFLYPRNLHTGIENAARACRLALEVRKVLQQYSVEHPAG